MDVGTHYSDAEVDLLSELRQYFPPDTADHDILELYQNPEQFQQYIAQLQSYYKEMQDNYSVYEECIIPVFQQSLESVWLLLLYCLILRMLSMARIPKQMLHIASFIFGCFSLWKFYGELMIYILVPVTAVIIVCKLKRIPGLFLAALTGFYMIACEYILLSPVDWTKIKGSVMIVSMKIISVAFDQEVLTKDQISTIELFGYIFNPASLIFGPFITMKNYRQLFMNHQISLNWIFNCCKVLLISCSCLLWSSCGTTHYLPKASNYFPSLENNQWWKAYREAQQFRFSHYFVCYLSEATCLLMGVGSLVTTSKKEEIDEKGMQDKKNKKQNEVTKDNEATKQEEELEITWRSPVANLMIVEFPRSLVDVVTNWNLPMHYWLKQYIFKSTRKFGVFTAILITYLASSLLHSLNFQLSAVLLSIGVFAYVESVFRHALASLSNACIEARKCRGECQHKYKKNNFWVMAINILFAFVAVWNLAYLGCLFDNSAEEVQGYSMSHALDKWKHYSYINHIVMFSVLVIQKLFLRRTGQ